MNSYKAGLADVLPPVELLPGPHGPLAFAVYAAERPWLHLLISHGFGEHMGWYDHVAQSLRDAGITTYIFDHYRHGRSAGPAADMREYSVLADGFRAALTLGVLPLREGGAPPLALLAHSNGALVALHALRMFAPDVFRGIVLSAPFLGMPGAERWQRRALLTVLHAVWPGLMVPVGRNPEMLTSDTAIWPQYAADPLRFKRVSVRFVRALGHGLAAAVDWNSCHGLPLLLLSGDRDEVVSFDATRRWFDRLQTADKTMTVIPGLQHELFQEPVWPTVVADICAWLRARFAP